jgi:hypothetical protein
VVKLCNIIIIIIQFNSIQFNSIYYLRAESTATIIIIIIIITIIT